jgi:hypothetical protein
MRDPTRFATTLTIALGMIGPPSLGQDGAPAQPEESMPPAETTPALEIEVMGGAWFPRLRGNVALGPGAGSIDLKNQLSLDNSEVAIRGEVLARIHDRWQLRFTYSDFETDQRGTFSGVAEFGSLSLVDGDAFNSSVDLTAYALEFGYDFKHAIDEAPGVTFSRNHLYFTPVVGAAFTDVDHRVEQIGIGVEDRGGEWFWIYGGLEMNVRIEPETGVFSLPFAKSLTIGAGATAGIPIDSDLGLIWQIRAGATIEILDNIGIEAGYRLLELDGEDGDYQFDAGLQGLFVGGVIRF